MEFSIFLQLCVNGLVISCSVDQRAKANQSGPMTCSAGSDWSEEEMRELCTSYSSWHGRGNVVQIILLQLAECGFTKTHEEVEEQLKRSRLLTDEFSTQEEVRSATSVS